MAPTEPARRGGARGTVARALSICQATPRVGVDGGALIDLLNVIASLNDLARCLPSCPVEAAICRQAILPCLRFSGPIVRALLHQESSPDPVGCSSSGNIARRGGLCRPDRASLRAKRASNVKYRAGRDRGQAFVRWGASKSVSGAHLFSRSSSTGFP